MAPIEPALPALRARAIQPVTHRPDFPRQSRFRRPPKRNRPHAQLRADHFAGPSALLQPRWKVYRWQSLLALPSFNICPLLLASLLLRLGGRAVTEAGSSTRTSIARYR